MFLQYPAVSAPGSSVLFPVNEGRLSGGLCIDRHGDPDLMAAFSAEYLKQYRAIVPKGRLPQSMVEMMPPLLLLMNAAEFALKADLIRSEKPKVGHGLQDRYGELEDEHRDEVDRRFADAALRSGRPGSLLTLAPHRSGRAGSAASGSSTDSFATRRRVPAGPGSQAMATAIPKACLASSAIRCRDVETGPNLGVLAVFPSNGATCRCPLPSTGSRGLNSPASAVL